MHESCIQAVAHALGIFAFLTRHVVPAWVLGMAGVPAHVAPLETLTTTPNKGWCLRLQVVFGVGKSPDQIATMLTSICERQRLAIATRIEPDMYAAVRKLVQGVCCAS